MSTKTGEAAFCYECGEQIRPDARYCPECGINQQEDDIGTPETDSGPESYSLDTDGGSVLDNISPRLSKFDILVVGSSLLLMISTFLDWAGNPLASVTGIQTEFGQITLLASILTMAIPFSKVSTEKRMGPNILIGIILLLFLLMFASRIAEEEMVSSGGGLILAFCATVLIIIFSISGIVRKDKMEVVESGSQQ